MDHRNLQEWYNALNSRTVDLVGDFVGDELFIIEGDSILLHCFSNDKLDFSEGFQLLHATYLVEKLMQKLQQRKCVFHIVFFAQNPRCCIPATAPDDIHDRYMVAREVIIQHLISVSRQSSSMFATHKFDSVESDEFTSFLAKSGVYLFLCHDGAFVEHDQTDEEEDSDEEDSSEEDSSEEDICDCNGSEDGTAAVSNDGNPEAPLIYSHEMITKIKLRMMIRWLVAHGHNIALINSLEFRDTKIMAIVIEGSYKRTKQTLHSLVPEHIDPLPEFELEGHNDGMTPLDLARASELLEKVIWWQPDLTQSQCLVVVTLSIMFLDADVNTCITLIGAQCVLLHVALRQNVRLSDRGARNVNPEGMPFFNELLRVARALLSSVSWEKTMAKHQLPCDLSDFVDGRLFCETWIMVHSLGLKQAILPSLESPYNSLASLVDNLCGTTMECTSTGRSKANHGPAVLSKSTIEFSDSAATVLPFDNPVFNTHLQPVQLSVDKSNNLSPEVVISRNFEEQSHWHSSKPLDQKAKMTIPPEILKRMLRKNQFFMAEMMDYAASLSGSTGWLKPETIIVESSQNKARSNKRTGAKYIPSSQQKKSQSKSGAPSIREMAAATIQHKQEKEAQGYRLRWKEKQKEFIQITDLPDRFLKVNDYLFSLSKATRQTLAAEVLTYALDTLVRLIFAKYKSTQGKKHVPIATRIWELITRLTKLRQGVSAEIVTHVGAVCKLLKLPVPQLEAQNHEPLSFSMFETPNPCPDVGIEMSPVEFQLLHGGPFMERGMESLPDARTPEFEPDHWQRDVLDQIDAKKSVLVVAPTSAGKTFISFYAMRQILKESNDGILVYVAPTKALVNQIAAEVQARFSKSYPSKTSGKSVWAIHTRDYRIHDPMGCQILVTVPHILQIMLLAPSNANAWTPRIKRIIFDEIHCIGQADDGLVWEQLLLLAPCPIIALSATVGNPREFYNWLHLAQGTNGFDLKIVQHKHRYSELRKYVYHPPQNFLFKGFAQHGKLPRLGLDALEDMEFVHPATSLLDRSRGIPEDLDLEPRDCLTLWRAMRDVQTKDFPVQSSLDPTLIFLDTIIQKKHIIEWQTKLKDLLEEWMKDRDSPFELVLRQLDHIENQPSYLGVKTQSKVSDLHALSIREGSEVLDTTLPLISSLHSQGALPALFFNYDRALCEDICYTLLTQLKSSENVWKKESSVWKRDFEQWNQWKLSREQADRKDTKSKKKKSNGDEQSSRAEQMRDSASVERSQFESFDPEKPVDGFHLANYKMLPSEFPAYIRELRRREVQEWLIEALERGIGVHHAGMNRKYRYVCEILFRRGFLRVVIATGTLALGINMPCKTVVFSGDSIFLTALNFRQAAGRAGRRGFDMLGNVVFQHVPTSKMKRLISSRLPDLNGHFPITTSLVLRLFILLEGSNGSVSAVRSINSLLSTPRIYLGGPEMKETVLHHLRFSIEYLRRNNLLGSTGQPLDFAGVISHLYHTETASFAFHALLRAGYFFTLCENIKTNPKTTMRTLMLVMSHLFGRQSVRLSTLESYWSAEKRPSSKVVLPPLPKKAASVLSSHNEQVLSIYTGYVQSFINQHVKEEDCFLPFSGIKCGGDYSAETLGLSNSNRNSTMVTSPFFALSGHGDRWDTIADLCEMIRSGVWLEESVIPYLCASEQEDVIPLNAYLLDFFKHGSIRQLETANHIRRGDIWFVLNDFSLILATINTTLRNFLDPRGSIDADMLNVVGGGDAHDISVDNQFVDEENPETKKTGTRRPDQIESEEIQIPLPVFKSSAKDTLENWEDEMAEDSEDSKFKHRSSQSTKKAVNSKFQQKVTSDKSMALVARGFQMLQDEFDRKFKAMWA